MTGSMMSAVNLHHFHFGTYKISSASFSLHKVSKTLKSEHIRLYNTQQHTVYANFQFHVTEIFCRLKI
jgi:hypothetical protein